MSWAVDDRSLGRTIVDYASGQTVAGLSGGQRWSRVVVDKLGQGWLETRSRNGRRWAVLNNGQR
jgi:hypothetical protein